MVSVSLSRAFCVEVPLLQRASTSPSFKSPTSKNGTIFAAMFRLCGVEDDSAPSYVLLEALNLAVEGGI